MKKIGFKFSWEQDVKPKRSRKPKNQEDETPMIMPGTPLGHLVEVQMRIDQHESIIASPAFSRMKKQEKLDTLASYRFLLTTLAMIQPQAVSGGLSEFGGIDVDYEM